MVGWEGRYFSLLLFSWTFFIKLLHAHQPLFKDLPSHVLLRHISVSRHLPLCLVIRNHETGSKLENVLHNLWKDKDVFHNTSSWEVGAFTLEKDPDVLSQAPTTLPSVRCYLGETIHYDYNGKPAKPNLIAWFRKLFHIHSEHQGDVSLEVVDTAVKSHRFTIIAFPNMHLHKEVEDIVFQIGHESEEHLKTLVVHPHSENRKVIQDFFNVVTIPAAIVVHNQDDEREPVVKMFPELSLKRANIETYIEARRVPATHLTLSSFKKLVMDTSEDKIPWMVAFYSFWSPNVFTYLRFFKQTVQEFSQHNVVMNFGLVDLSEEKLVISRYIDPMKATSFPFILLFTKDMERGGVRQRLLRDKRPSPYTVYAELKTLEVDIITDDAEPFVYQPYGPDVSNEVCRPHEGPYGFMCTTLYHNKTDITQKFKPIKKTEKKPRKKTWPHRHIMDEIDATLPKEDGIPVVSHRSWGQVIENSHAPRHPLAPEGIWAGEYTKVALIVFLIDGCGSCRRNWDVFKQLNQAVKYVDGGAFYIANCTADPQVCTHHGVTGFPTIVAFRGFGWLGHGGCVSQSSEKEAISIRLDYHGVILEDSIMEWFSSVSSQAVTNLKFQHPPPITDTNDDIRLVATLMPKHSRFLPKQLQDSPEVFYPYECYRLACERLFGQTQCYTVYNTHVPAAEFEEDNLDVVVIKVRMERRDGVHVDISDLGRYLRHTISEEHGTHLHTFHKPHRYQLGATQKCEDDHGACTDLITAFTRDHARLPVTHLTATAFHTKNNPLFEDNIPVLLSLVHLNNITASSEFLQMLTSVGTELYKELAVVTVDVDLYPDWVSKFVPFGYARKAAGESGVPALYHYPRLCMLLPSDHNHAAFYPPVDYRLPIHKFVYTMKGVTAFAEQFLKNPNFHMIQTEHF